ncbi:thioesterase domain-containing protein [Dactylosporangium sp. NPDC051484]|uniref:thioesterase domain-containing protein n=1 Tax=Dactylosporangium sp. NPDC051484 TaxID=3154942 RepID=UPI00344FB534
MTVGIPPDRLRLLRQLRQSAAPVSPVAADTTVVVKPDGGQPPLFLVPAVSGSPYAYLGLRTLLPADQPAVSFEGPGLSGSAPPSGSVEQLAAHYLTAIRRRWPHGPYLLAGWSFGGTVAFEMAHQLTAAGARVVLLALVDGAVPGTFASPDEDEVAAAFTRDLAGYGITADALEPDVRQRRYAVFRANMRAYRAYRARVWSGPAVLIRGATSTEPTAGWHEWCRGPVVERVVPGDHYSMWEPASVGAVADALSAAARTALAGE